MTLEDIENELSRDIKDLIRYEPGISVSNSAGRFGLSGFNVRGIDGNRVLIEVDGIPVPDSFGIGSFASAGRDFVDIESLKQVEILRGAASSLYGSDAIGGVVAFVTKDPADYFGAGTGPVHADGSAAWYDADDSYTATATGAWKGDFLAGLDPHGAGSPGLRLRQPACEARLGFLERPAPAPDGRDEPGRPIHRRDLRPAHAAARTGDGADTRPDRQ